MQILAFILALVAVVVFAVEFAQRRSLIALGLGFAVAAWIVQLVWVSQSTITIH
jgi:hypothetical protein